MIESIPVAVCKCPPVVDLDWVAFWCFLCVRVVVVEQR